MKTRYILIPATLFICIIPHFASAAFVNGIESFDGTVKDTTTWEEYTKWGNPIYQDDKLFLENSSMDYTTKDITVGVGDIVRVELCSHPETTDGVTRSVLNLTNNSEGTNNSTYWDSRFLFIYLQFSPSVDEFGFSVGEGSSGGSSGAYIGPETPPPSIENPYILEIERTSSTTARFSAYYSDMTLIDSYHTSFFRYDVPVPDELFISLSFFSSVYSSGAVFDNVTIVPEPTTFFLLGLGGLMLRRKRRT